MRLRTLLPTALLLSAAPLQAQRVVYWTDDESGTNVIPSAIAQLQALRPGVTAYAATSQDDFDAQLASGTTALAIFGEQGDYVYAGSQSALTAYLTGGGRVLGATWLEGGLASLLGASSVASSNGTSITGAGALFAGIAGAVGVANPGWTTFSQGYGTAAGSGCLATLSSGGCAAVQGNGGDSLLLSPLFDSYASDAEGGRFVANGANLLLGGVTSTVPEPSTYVLMGTGLLTLGGVAARRKRTV
jgi:hypothetical protein